MFGLVNSVFLSEQAVVQQVLMSYVSSFSSTHQCETHICTFSIYFFISDAVSPTWSLSVPMTSSGHNSPRYVFHICKFVLYHFLFSFFLSEVSLKVTRFPNLYLLNSEMCHWHQSEHLGPTLSKKEKKHLSQNVNCSFKYLVHHSEQKHLLRHF